MDSIFHQLGIEKHLTPLEPLIRSAEGAADEDALLMGKNKDVEEIADPYRSPKYVVDEDDSDGGSDSGDISFNRYRKRIRLGLAYQTSVPKMITQGVDTRKTIRFAHDKDMLANDAQSENKLTTDSSSRIATPPLKSKLIWSPHKISAEKVAEYIYTLKMLFVGEADFNEEKALTLLHECNYDVTKALEIACRKPLISSRKLIASMWSDAEKEKFELLVRRMGKDFVSIHHQMRPRTLREVIQYYHIRPSAKRPSTVAELSANLSLTSGNNSSLSVIGTRSGANILNQRTHQPKTSESTKASAAETCIERQTSDTQQCVEN